MSALLEGARVVSPADKLSSAFALAAQMHANVGACSFRRVVIDDGLLQAFVHAAATVFHELDREDDEQRRIARCVWLLRSTLLQTTLEFDDARLQVDALMTSLSRAAQVVPSIAGSFDVLQRTVSLLRSGHRNAKRLKLTELLNTSADEGAGSAVVVSLCGPNTPGWPNELLENGNLFPHHTAAIRTRKDLRSTVFKSIVIPGSPRFIAKRFLTDLLYGGRTADIVLLTYKAERGELPPPLPLPDDGQFVRLSPNASLVLDRDKPSEREEQSQQAEGAALDDWIESSLRDSILALQRTAVPASARDASVKARFVLFLDGSGAFLPEDGHVVEISERFDEGIGLDKADSRVPRKSVLNLDEGDLVMLRLEGSGDYLEEVADGMMSMAGQEGLRASAVSWKDDLHAALKRHGEGVVSKKLKANGATMRNAQYLWTWASNVVMAPAEFETFRSLVRTVSQLTPLSFQKDSDSFAKDRWDEMERIKAFHMRAGAAIRAALVERIEALIAERVMVDTVRSIELPGVRAGKMGLLRVAGIDSTSVKVPFSSLFHLHMVRS